MKKIIKSISLSLVAAIIMGVVAVPAAARESSRKTVRLGGQPFGVKFYSDGVMIIELEEFFDGEKYVCPASKAGLRVNDVINSINGIPIKTNEDVISVISNGNGETLNVNYKRNGETGNAEIKPEKNTVGIYLLGAWIRDSSAGIGTVTYYDENHNYFAALGHGICDNDTGALMPLRSAEIINVNVRSVNRSLDGAVGSLNGYFGDKVLGNLTKNTSIGVFGTTSDNFISNHQEIEIADFKEIKRGEAQLYTTISGEKEEKYSVEITDIRNHNSESNENFVIKITDKRLLEKCGGIVQGMSGSPIVQDGKLVGAVTHVFVNRVSEGYGVAAQFMVSNYVE